MDDTSNEVRFERFDVSVLFVCAAVSIGSLLTLPRLVLVIMLPEFCPAIPPALCWATTSPSETQELIRPLPVLIPAIPPASSFARTFPRKLQFRIDPAFSPAMPPTDTASAPGSIAPSTLRFRITAPSPTCRTSPCCEPSEWIMSPRIAWPCPSSTPEKYGIAVKLLPIRLISFSRITSKSLEFVSTLQLWASASRSSASVITIC